MFIVIWMITAGAQILIVEVGFRAFEVNQYGLTVEQWFTCIAWGAIPLVWRFLLLLIPGFKKSNCKKPDSAQIDTYNPVN